MTRASLDKAPGEVAAMFDAVARRYDRTNGVLSLGLDRRWRKAVRHALQLQAGETVVDVAAGTATSSTSLAAAAPGVTVLACDFSTGMLRAAARRPQARPGAGVHLVAGDALRLPLPDAAVDAATISFGLRNVADVDAALREMLRVTRPGGRLVVCEFSSPSWPPFGTVYTEYLMGALPGLARRVSSDPEAYVYLAESIRAWPRQDELAARIEASGWGATTWRNLTGGVVALHCAGRR